MRILLLLMLLLLAAAAPARAQIDPDRSFTCWSCYSHNAHFMFGAGLDLAVRPMPFLAKSWRHSPIGRVGLVAVAGIGWELTDVAWCQDKRNVAHGNVVCAVDSGFGIVDWTYDVAGAIATELLTAGLRRLAHAVFR